MIVFATLCLCLTGAPLLAQLAPSFTVRHAILGGNFLWGIASGPTGLVAVGDGGTILTSPNGTTWSRRDSGVTDWLVAVTYGAGQYLAVGDHGRILTSSDGASWITVPQSVTTARLNNILYAAGLFVAVGETGTILTSPDARVWTKRDSRITTWLRGLAYASTPANNSSPGYTNNEPSQFWTCGQNGVILGSRDGLTWGGGPDFHFSPNPRKDLEAMAGLSAIGADGTCVFALRNTDVSKTPIISPTGGTYTAVTSWLWWGASTVGLSTRFRGLASGAGGTFAVGEGGVIAQFTNATPWLRLESGTTASLTNGVYAGNSLFVVGENETILQSTPFYNSRLLNISTRGRVDSGERTLISGLVIEGSAPKRVLVRAAGPALAAFGLSGALPAPVLTVFDHEGREIAANTRWGSATAPSALATAATQVGAFPFAANSADSALLLTLNPGRYTIQVTGANSTSGTALVEAYDADGLAHETSRTINISTRGEVTPTNQLIAGFNIGGTAARRVLVRAIGPSLATFGVTGTLAEPQVTLYGRDGSRYSSFDRDGSFVILDSTFHLYAGIWSARRDADQLRGAAYLAGAFALTEDSNDAVLLATLPPGSYTAVVTGLNNSTGVALIEVYDLP